MKSKSSIYLFLTGLFYFVSMLPILFGTVHAGCKVARPSSPPVLVSAIPQDRSVILVWTEAQDPVTYYLLRYGLSKESVINGNPNIGPRGTNSYVVTELTNGVKYHFQVMAGNGCKPGEFSNTLTAVPGSGQNSGVSKLPSNLSIYKNVLGASTSASTKDKKLVKPTPHAGSNTQSKKNCALNCQGGPLLGAEIILLLVFFGLVYINPHIIPVFSMFIPGLMYAFFYITHRNCGSGSFLCQYFLPIDIGVYVIFLILQKYFLSKRVLKVKKRQIKQ